MVCVYIVLMCGYAPPPPPPLPIQLVMECNDGARKMERTEQLHIIHQQLDFRKLKVRINNNTIVICTRSVCIISLLGSPHTPHTQPFPLVSVSRQLERRGTVMRLKVEQKLFGRHMITKKQLYLFVFTDMVIITKRKKE